MLHSFFKCCALLNPWLLPFAYRLTTIHDLSLRFTYIRLSYRVKKKGQRTQRTYHTSFLQLVKSSINRLNVTFLQSLQCETIWHLFVSKHSPICNQATSYIIWAYLHTALVLFKKGASEKLISTESLTNAKLVEANLEICRGYTELSWGVKRI